MLIEHIISLQCGFVNRYCKFFCFFIPALFDIEYSESIRMIKNRNTTGSETEDESYILSDFYLNREFSDSELRLLIDGLLFSKHIPYSQCKKLISKLEGLSNIYFRSRVKHIAMLLM